MTMTQNRELSLSFIESVKSLVEPLSNFHLLASYQEESYSVIIKIQCKCGWQWQRRRDVIGLENHNDVTREHRNIDKIMKTHLADCPYIRDLLMEEDGPIIKFTPGGLKVRGEFAGYMQNAEFIIPNKSKETKPVNEEEPGYKRIVKRSNYGKA